jgi:hypothetical protein
MATADDDDDDDDDVELFKNSECTRTEPACETFVFKTIDWNCLAVDCGQKGLVEMRSSRERRRGRGRGGGCEGM